MKILYKIINQILSILYCFFTFRWRLFFQLYNKDAKTIIWIWPSFPNQLIYYFSRPLLLHDLGYINAFLDTKQEFKIVLGKNIHRSKCNYIFLTPSKLFNYNNEINYSAALSRQVQELELSNNKIIPNSYEISFWENKVYMHQKFDEIRLSAPRTLAVTYEELATHKYNSVFPYPFLIKEPHSFSSQGVHKINGPVDLDNFIEKKAHLRGQTILLQELLSIKKDLRVICVGDKIVLHYWRVNNESEWRPTSTDHGSKVDFSFFPDKWRTYILDLNKKLEISVGAYDICWQNDNLDTLPIILEVSTTFLPNPPMPSYLGNIPYKKYKRLFITRKPYFIEKVKVIFEIRKSIVELYISKNGKD